MLTIYAIDVSLYCAKLRIALRHKRLQWREVAPPGGYGSGAYKQIVPSGNLPALVDEAVDGGLLIGDSEAIVEYLEETRPSPSLLPSAAPARARSRERSRFHDTRLEPELRQLFPEIRAEASDRDLVGRQAGAMSDRLAQLARLLDARDGAELTLGDCGFPVTFAWIDALAPRLDFTVHWPVEVIDYRNRVERLEAVAAELASYRPRLTRWLDADDEA